MSTHVEIGFYKDQTIYTYTEYYKAVFFSPNYIGKHALHFKSSKCSLQKKKSKLQYLPLIHS